MNSRSSIRRRRRRQRRRLFLSSREVGAFSHMTQISKVKIICKLREFTRGNHREKLYCVSVDKCAVQNNEMSEMLRHRDTESMYKHVAAQEEKQDTRITINILASSIYWRTFRMYTYNSRRQLCSTRVTFDTWKQDFNANIAWIFL